jgi:hypothetical protein
MNTELTLTSLQNALSAASECHHDYELNILHGEPDEQWAGWYAAYVLGRLGNFVSPATLTQWLEDTPNEENWSALAA